MPRSLGPASGRTPALGRKTSKTSAWVGKLFGSIWRERGIKQVSPVPKPQISSWKPGETGDPDSKSESPPLQEGV